jgi:hypothetical protein
VLIWQHEQVTTSFFENDKKAKTGLPKYINRMTNQQSQQSGLNDQQPLDTINGASYDQDPYQWAIDAGFDQHTATEYAIDALYGAQTGYGAVDPFAQFSNGASTKGKKSKNTRKPLNENIVSSLAQGMHELSLALEDTGNIKRYRKAALEEFKLWHPDVCSVWTQK